MGSTQIHNQQNGYSSSEPRFDFCEVRHPEDAIFLFRVKGRLHARHSSVIYFINKCAAVKIKSSSFTLCPYDEMLQGIDSVDCCTLATAVDCFCRLKCVDFGFSIHGTRLKCGVTQIVNGCIDSNIYYTHHRIGEAYLIENKHEGSVLVLVVWKERFSQGEHRGAADIMLHGWGYKLSLSKMLIKMLMRHRDRG